MRSQNDTHQLQCHTETIKPFQGYTWDAENHGPTSVLSWLPFLWKRVLFPGATPQSGPTSWRELAFVFLLPAVLLYPWMGFQLFEPDEGRYAQIPSEMIERGDWIVPSLQGEPYLDKPPLFYWAVMGCFSLFGYAPWAARVAPALCVHSSLLVAYFFGRRWCSPLGALWGTLLLTFAPGFVGMGRLLVLDGMLTLFVTTALFSALEAVRGEKLKWGWWLLAALAEGLGVMTKGPIAILLVVIPLLAWRWLTQAKTRIGLPAYLVFASIIAAICLPWYVAVFQRTPEFAGHFLWEHNIMRFLQPFDHEEPVWYFLPIVVGGLLPGTLLLPAGLRFLLSARAEESSQRSGEMGFLLLAGLWCVFFFSMSGSKLPTYILPAFPPLSLALGMFVAQSQWSRRGLTRWTLASWGAFLLVANAVIIPSVAQDRSPLKHADTLDAYCRDPNVPVYCFPRNIDSAAFYLSRSDMVSYRTKDMAQLFQEMDMHPKSVVLFSHRSSLQGMESCLPPHMKMTFKAPLGLCDMAVVERKQ